MLRIPPPQKINPGLGKIDTLQGSYKFLAKHFSYDNINKSSTDCQNLVRCLPQQRTTVINLGSYGLSLESSTLSRLFLGSILIFILRYYS